MQRRNYIGGSDVALILGMQPFGRSEWDVWLRLKHPDLYYANKTEAELEDRLALEMGKRLESLGLELLASALATGERSDWTLAAGTNDDAEAVYGDKPWKGCHEDGWLVSPDGSKRLLLEAKTSNQHDVNAAFADGDIPEYYRAQLIWMCHIFGEREAAICCIDKAYNRHNIVLAKFSDEEVADVVNAVESWYARHIEGDEPVLPAGNLASVTARAVLGDGVGEREADETETELIESLAVVTNQLKELEEVKSNLQDALKLRMGEVGTLRSSAGSVNWKAPKNDRKVVDIKGIEAARPELVAQFTTYEPAARRWGFYPAKGKK